MPRSAQLTLAGIPTRAVGSFGGHADSKWPLFAKAYRVAQAPYAPFGVARALGDGKQEWSVYAEAETDILQRFGQALDRAGMSIPTPALEVGGTAAVRISSSDTKPDIIPLLALAQHIGLPTKLLDWTRQSRVAAYFAASEAAREPKELDLTLWALRTEFVWSIAARSVDNTELTVQTAPSVSNPNLHDQQGLFTRVQGENAHRYPLDQFVIAAGAAAKGWKIEPWERNEGKIRTSCRVR